MKFPKFKSKFMLAPMAGINDKAFRILCRENGCGLVFSEMISSPALCRNNKATWNLLDFDNDKSEKPFGIQLFGQKPELISEAAKLMEKKFSPDVIDLNLGCPAAKIIRQGSGSALLIRKNRVKEIVSECVNTLNTPFTVKIRSGPDSKKIVGVEIAKICEEAGACAITVHPRTTVQGYSGKAKWDVIKQVKESVSIPVIGNGDVNSPEEAKRMLEETGCDYVMIGRGAMKNPYLFKQINDYFEKGSYEETNESTKKKLVKRYFELAEEHKTKFAQIKVHIQHLTTGISGGAKIRLSVSRSKSLEELKKIILDFF